MTGFSRAGLAVVGVAILWIVSRSVAQAQYEYPFRNPALSTEERAANIVSLLSLDEKLAALGNPAIARLGIPGFGTAEGIHQAMLGGGFGGARQIPSTSFSQVYGMGETWDPALIQRAGAVEGYEARYATQKDVLQL